MKIASPGKKKNAGEKLVEMYEQMFAAFGPRHWWPAKTAEEVIIGAILAQNTSWSNARKAIDALHRAGIGTFKAIHETDLQRLANLIKSARFMNQKAKTLRVFSGYFKDRYSFSLRRMKKVDLHTLRAELLDLYRIGPETADSILLYSLEKPTFVIDAYTKRICSRHDVLAESESYDTFQQFFMDNLPQDVRLYNEYHALLVHTGYLYCKPKPLCEACPLRSEMNGLLPKPSGI